MYQSLTNICCQAMYDLKAALKVQKGSDLAEEIQRQETMRLVAEQEEKAEMERVERMESAKQEIEAAKCDLDAKMQLLREVQKDIVDNLKVGNGDNDDKIEEENKEDDEGSESVAGSLPAVDNKSVSLLFWTLRPTLY